MHHEVPNSDVETKVCKWPVPTISSHRCWFRAKT